MRQAFNRSWVLKRPILPKCLLILNAQHKKTPGGDKAWRRRSLGRKPNPEEETSPGGGNLPNLGSISCRHKGTDPNSPPAASCTNRSRCCSFPSSLPRKAGQPWANRSQPPCDPFHSLFHPLMTALQPRAQNRHPLPLRSIIQT